MERRIGVKRKNLPDSYNKRQTKSSLITPVSIFFLVLATAILAIPAWYGWQSNYKVKIIDEQLKYIVKMEGTYLYRDEALTMSLNMAVSTGDMKI